MRVRLETVGSVWPTAPFEGHHRHAAPAPADDPEVPGGRVGHFGRRLIADDLGNAGSRHDQSLPDQRNQQAIQLVAQI